MKMKLLIVGALLIVSGAALSQMTPQMQQQLPPSDPSSSQYGSVYLPGHGVGDTVQPGSKQRWEDRWGAIAADSGASTVFGIVTNMPNERAAQKAAVSECENRGGVDCKAGFTYRSQCAAIAASTKQTFVQGAAYEEDAKRMAMGSCVATGEQCWVYYSGCSLPERVQ